MASVFLVPQLVRRLGRPQESIALEGPSFRTIALITANWFLCQWTFNLSLAQTALSTNTLLSSSSVVWAWLGCVWTCVLGLVEHLHLWCGLVWCERLWCKGVWCELPWLRA